MSQRHSKSLIYRVVPHNGGLVFALPDRARLIAKIHSAINCSGTWAEFRAAMPPKEYEDILCSAFDAHDEARPEDDDQFDGEMIPGWTDGDYPPWLQVEMSRILPQPVLERFGTLEQTTLNGAYWHIPQTEKEAICEALQSLGWDLEEAQDLPFH